MPTIEIKPDCGNAPRKVFLAELNTAFAKGDLSYIKSIIPEKITWETIGRSKIVGKEAFLLELRSRPNWKVKRLTIDTIITHGSEASVNGQITASDNSRYSFCDIYKFKGAGGTVLNSILTFLIERTEENA